MKVTVGVYRQIYICMRTQDMYIINYVIFTLAFNSVIHVQILKHMALACTYLRKFFGINGCTGDEKFEVGSESRDILHQAKQYIWV